MDGPLSVQLSLDLYLFLVVSGAYTLTYFGNPTLLFTSDILFDQRRRLAKGEWGPLE